MGIVLGGLVRAEGIGGAIHAAGGAEGVGVTAGGAPGTALLKVQASITAAKRQLISQTLKMQPRSTAAKTFSAKTTICKPASMQQSVNPLVIPSI